MTTPAYSPGQRKVLSYIWSLHDTFIPWGPNWNCALLHHGVLCLCSLHDQRWNGKVELVNPEHTSHSGILSHASFAFLHPIRQKNVSGCWKRQQKSTKICTAWQWRDKASTAISSVCMWSPNTWEKTLPSSRRYEGAQVLYCLLLTAVANCTCVKTAYMMRFRSCLSLGGCPPVRLLSSSWSCLTWSNIQNTCLPAVVLVR